MSILCPLKVTAVLSEPVAGLDAPHLDAILESCMRRHVPSVLRSSGGHRHTGADTMTPGTIPIPIDRRLIPGYPFPVPCCSSAILGYARDGVEHFAKRLDVSDPSLVDEQYRRQVNNTGGEFKAYRLPLRVRAVDRIVWFCVGRGKSGTGRGMSGALQIRKLLKQVDAIGKKTVHGFGRVTQWIVEPIGDDWSWFAPTEAGPALMRTLPTCVKVPDGLIGFRRSIGSPVPPYWERSQRVEVIEPC